MNSSVLYFSLSNSSTSSGIPSFNQRHFRCVFSRWEWENWNLKLNGMHQQAQKNRQQQPIHVMGMNQKQKKKLKIFCQRFETCHLVHVHYIVAAHNYMFKRIILPHSCLFIYFFLLVRRFSTPIYIDNSVYSTVCLLFASLQIRYAFTLCFFFFSIKIYSIKLIDLLWKGERVSELSKRTCRPRIELKWLFGIAFYIEIEYKPAGSFLN